MDTSFSYVWYFEVTCPYKEKGRGGRSQESLNNVDCGREGRLGRLQAGWGRGQAGKYSRRQVAPKQQRHEAILPTSMGTFQRRSSNSHYRPLPQVSASLIYENEHLHSNQVLSLYVWINILSTLSWLFQCSCPLMWNTFTGIKFYLYYMFVWTFFLQVQCHDCFNAVVLSCGMKQLWWKGIPEYNDHHKTEHFKM